MRLIFIPCSLMAILMLHLVDSQSPRFILPPDGTSTKRSLIMVKSSPPPPRSSPPISFLRKTPSPPSPSPPRPSPSPPSPRPPSPPPPVPKPKYRNYPPPPTPPPAPQYVNSQADYLSQENWPNTPPQPPAPPGGKRTSASQPTSAFKPNDPSFVGDFNQIGVGNIVAVHLVHVPGSEQYFFMERPSGKHPVMTNKLQATAIAGAFDVETHVWTDIPYTDSLFCSGHTILSNGNVLVVGGHLAKSGYDDGRTGIRILDRNTLVFKRVGSLQFPRWYPTATLLPNGMVMVVGGTQKPGSGSAMNPQYEVWDPANPTTTKLFNLQRNFIIMAKDIYYPFIYVMPFTGHVWMFCGIYGQIIDPMTSAHVQDIPSYTKISPSLNTEYPYTGSSVMLPLLPKNNYQPSILVVGGNFNYAWVNTTASNMIFRLNMTIGKTPTKPGAQQYGWNGGWTMDAMPTSRVMPDVVLLPNGYIVILNGAQTGLAGDSISGGAGKCNNPNLQPYLYNPNAPSGNRFTALAPSLIPRLYHATAALTTDGSIFVSGCDRCANYWSDAASISPSPWGLPEYRIELLRTPFWFNFTAQPVIDEGPGDITYGNSFSVIYHMFKDSDRADSAVLVAPSSTTHSNNMHQRVVGMVVVANAELSYGEVTMTLKAPPDATIAPPGMYMLFLLKGDVYSKSVWVKLSK